MHRDLNGRTPSAATPAETTIMMRNKFNAVGGDAINEDPPKLSSFDLRRSMAQEIMNYEARRDHERRLVVYRLPIGDGGGRFEVAGINERYHREVCLRLVQLIEAGQHAEAEALAAEYIANYTDVVDRWCSEHAIEFFLRDCAFNRGPGGAAWIAQRACGVETDMIVGNNTRAAIRSKELDPAPFLDELVLAREAYEREKVGRDESSRFWKGLVSRWRKARQFAQTFLVAPETAGAEAFDGSISVESVYGLPEASFPSVSLSQDGKIAKGQSGLTIEYRGSDSCPYGRSATAHKKPFRAIVVHHTDPRFNVDWYVQYQINGDKDRGGHFGYHFYIGEDGRIIQGAPLTKRTNHVKPAGEVQRRAFGKEADNTNAIGITCNGAGRASFQPTEQQLRSLYALTRALCMEYGIGFQSIYGHGEIQTDRHKTEGTSAAQVMRGWPVSADAELAGIPLDDDLDDSPIDEAVLAGAAPRFEITMDYSGIAEDSDDESDEALLPGEIAQTENVAIETAATVRYVNQNSVRNKKCTKNLEDKLEAAVVAVYGGGCTVNIYSGGQDKKGRGKRRTGSIRHDDYGSGGRAADVHVFDQAGRQIQGLQLARLGQYWLAMKYGCVGHEMAGGGIHVDEWTTPPPGGGMFWMYEYSQSKPWGAEAKRMLERGAKGVLT